MRLHTLVLSLALGPVAVASLVNCSSDSGGGGAGCQKLAGTYHGRQCGTDDTVVTQTGCTATVTSGSNPPITGTVAGNKFTAQDGSVSCVVNVTGTTYTSDCTQKDAMGTPQTCHESGAVELAPSGSGAGGSNGVGGNVGTGGSVTGSGGNLGSGGAEPGSGGAGTGQCSASYDSGDATCDACMTANCCTELEACGAGSACAALAQCIQTSCPNADDACLNQACPEAFQAGVDAFNAIVDCDTNHCQGC